MSTTSMVQPRGGMPFLKHFIIAVILWSGAAAAVIVGELDDNRSFLTANALSSARATFEKDIAFRRWAARHGGVYVPTTEETPPNPYLTLPERDITTPSGRQLTLMNPAYMTRQVYEISSANSNAPQGHITSLNPLRPENGPDPWERKALELFEKGTPEFSAFQTIDGKPYFRFMRPLTAEKPCLKCHAAQGYREGDLRGGISVSIPMATLIESTERSSRYHIMVIVLGWLLGVAGLWFGLRRIGLSSLALRESEERYRQQFQQSQAVMLIIDPENGAIMDANPSACRFYGYSREDLLELGIFKINCAAPEVVQQAMAEISDGAVRQFRFSHRTADGSTRDVEVSSSPVLIGGRQLLHSIIFDISGRRAAEQLLLDKTDFAENLLRNSTTPTFVIDAEHRVLIWNRALEELTGIKAQEMAGSTEHWRAFYPSARPCLADIVLEGKFEQLPDFYAHFSRSRLIPDGLCAEGEYAFDNRRCRLVFSAAPIRDRGGRIIAVIETLEDITERISLETQLIQAQKMESVGVLAGGIAHDFNNVLTVINGYACLLQLTCSGDEQNLDIAREILASVERAADMTRSLLAFSGKQEMLKQYDDLNQILAGIRKSLGRLIREDITLTILPGAERLPVYVDRVQIEQILINLVVNARDAMGAGGTITVRAMPVHLEEPRREGNVAIPPGRHAVLSVSDSGSGMDSGTLERIFEPFFTTKERDKGTGLGLAIVRSIVTKHNGVISVTSQPGKGAEFRIYLPMYAGQEPQRRDEIMQTINLNGTETVLMVEDDIAVMKLLRNVLSRYGYRILAAGDGLEAMEIFHAHLDEIRIVVADVIMPRMNGRELIEQIRQRRPELPVIMISGYTDEIIDRAAIDELKVIFLQKPVKPLDLLATIRSRLNTSAES